MVGRPSSSISTPSGTGTPLLRATRALPKAMALVAMSSSRGSPRGAWYRGGERVGAEARIAAAVGRLQGRVVGDVGEVDRDHAGRRALLGPMADAADMGAVAQGHRDRAVGPGALDPPSHRLLGHGLAEAARRVEHQDAARVGHRRQCLVRNQQADVEQPDIVRQHADAVAVVPREIGRHQMVGDVLRLGLAAAHGADGQEHQVGQTLGGNVRHLGAGPIICRQKRQAPLLPEPATAGEGPTASIRQSACPTIGAVGRVGRGRGRQQLRIEGCAWRQGCQNASARGRLSRMAPPPASVITAPDSVSNRTAAAMSQSLVRRHEK